MAQGLRLLGVQIDVVGSVAAGIVAEAWSPDSSVLALVTGDGMLMALSYTFDIIFEVPLEVTEFGEAAPVTVGWGKKETQFQGSAGKLATQPKVAPVEVPFDDNLARIQWRPDGE